jgi:hypothetical protein
LLIQGIRDSGCPDRVLGYSPLVMNERQRTARARLRLIVAEAPRQQEPPAQNGDVGVVAGLRDLPGVSLRVGRHVTAWLLWHTARVCLVEEAPPRAAAELDRAARV